MNIVRLSGYDVLEMSTWKLERLSFPVRERISRQT